MINIFKVQRTISELPRPGCRESLGGGQKWFSQYCFMGKCHKGKHFYPIGKFFSFKFKRFKRLPVWRSQNAGRTPAWKSGLQKYVSPLYIVLSSVYVVSLYMRSS